MIIYSLVKRETLIIQLKLLYPKFENCQETILTLLAYKYVHQLPITFQPLFPVKENVLNKKFIKAFLLLVMPPKLGLGGIVMRPTRQTQ